MTTVIFYLVKGYVNILIGIIAVPVNLYNSRTVEAFFLNNRKEFAEIKEDDKPMCANVDLYSGLVYQVLGVPEDLYTPLFATARIAGWCAHRLEELTTSNRIMRPAYKSVEKPRKYAPIQDR